MRVSPAKLGVYPIELPTRVLSIYQGKWALLPDSSLNMVGKTGWLCLVLIVMCLTWEGDLKIYSSIPVSSILYEESKNSSYKDSVRISTERSDVQSWELIAAFFHSAPTWMKYLLIVRNKIVKYFGLKVGDVDENDVSPPFEAGQKFGVFKLFSVNSTEAVIGEDDVHLNFRISFIIDKENENELVMSTIVKINNRFGKVYMFFVKPFHRVLVLTMIKRMNKLINEKSLPYYSKMET